MTIDLVAKYLKIKALEEGGSTPAERSTAKQMRKALDAEYPALAGDAAKVADVLDGRVESNWQVLLRDIAVAAAGSAAKDFGASLTEPDRTDVLRRGQIIFTPHDCGEGQICLEIRSRAVDLLSRRYQSGIFDSIEDELERLATAVHE